MACILFCVACTYFNLNCASTVPPELFHYSDISLWFGNIDISLRFGNITIIT